MTAKAPRTVDEAALAANIACVKGTIQCDQVAELEVTLRSSGKHLRGQCPLPDHNGSSESFYCYAAENGRFERWKCHRCDVYGDVIDLYGVMYGLSHNTVWAMEGLAKHFDLKLWRDEDVMTPHQLMAKKARIAAEKRIERVITEMAFRRMVMPLINAIEDEEERAQQLEESLRSAGLVTPERGMS